MKAFKKLMAAALVCVMALSMLTGCAMGDKIDEKALVKALNKKHDVYVSENDLDGKAENAWSNAVKDGVVKQEKGSFKAGDVTYNYVLVEVPDSARKADNWEKAAGIVDTALNTTSATNKNGKIELGIKFKTGKKNDKSVDFVVVVAKAK